MLVSFEIEIIFVRKREKLGLEMRVSRELGGYLPLVVHPRTAWKGIQKVWSLNITSPLHVTLSDVPILVV